MRHWLSSAVIVLFAVATAESQPAQPKGKGPPEFMGKTYDQWRKELKSTDPSKRETAMKAVLMFDLPMAADAIPEIIADLARQKTIKVDLSVRVNGTMALNTYFLHAANAKKTPDAKVVKDALAVYRMGLKDTQVIMKVRSLQGLQFLGPPARDALEDVIVLARDTSTWEVRKEAIPVMVMLAYTEKGPADTKVMIALRASADTKTETSYLVRVVGVTGLGILGKENAVVDLRRALENDPSKEVRGAAVQALVHAKESALPDLRKALNQPNKEVRLLAVQALGAAGKEKALADILGVLDDTEKEMRLVGLNTVASMKDILSVNGKAASLKKLNGRLALEKDSILQVWTNATIMGVNGKCDDKHMQPILARLTDKDVPTKTQAFQAIAACGTEAKPFAWKTLHDLVDHNDTETAINAVDTLVLIRAYEAIPKFEKIKADAKANSELKEAAENALDNFKLLKEQEKKAKEKTPEKK